MPIPSPRCAWPATLDACGPQEDPSILLTGSAEIGDAPARIIAIRIGRMLRRVPDYRNDVPAEIYRTANLDAGLETFLENVEDLSAELSDVLGDYGPSVMHLDTGSYMMWILPLAPSALK
jgi:hypothetical protein